MKTLNLVMAIISGSFAIGILSSEPSPVAQLATVLWTFMTIIFALNYQEFKKLEK